MTWLEVLVLVIAQAAEETKGIDSTPIIVGAIAGLTGAGGAAFFTARSTNKKLEAESDRIYQEALKLADERAKTNVETMQAITQTLSERLTATETALDKAREKLHEAELKIHELELKADTIAADKDKALLLAQAERDKLQSRLLELEERYADLIAALPGKRRRDADAHKE